MSISFEFVGTTSQPLSLDPTEFRGMPVDYIAEEILNLLSEVAPGVVFYHDDVVLAADEIANEAAKAG